MITMKNFSVFVPKKDDALLGYTGENLSRRFEIEVDEPGAWAYKLDIRNDAGVANILDLTADGNILYVDIERAALQVSGKVIAQIRAIDGDKVKCSNTFCLFIGDSVEATAYFESLPPSEFEQLEARLTALKAKADAAALSAPKVVNGNWWVYDAAQEAYTDTGVQAQGPAGESGNGIRNMLWMKDATVYEDDRVVARRYKLYITLDDGSTTEFTVEGGADGKPGLKGDGISDIYFSEETDDGYLYYARVGVDIYPIMVPRGPKGADGKETVLFVQDDEPTEAKVGDLWFDTDEEVTTGEPPAGGGSKLWQKIAEYDVGADIAAGVTAWEESGFSFDELRFVYKSMVSSTTSASGLLGYINNAYMQGIQLVRTNGSAQANGGSGWSDVRLVPDGVLTTQTSPANSPTNYATNGLNAALNAIPCDYSDGKIFRYRLSTNTSHPPVSGTFAVYGR